MFNRLVLFLTIIIIVINMNAYHHIHDENNHSYHHEHIDLHETSIEHSIIHFTQDLDFQKNIGIIGGTILLLILFGISAYLFVYLLQTKQIETLPKITFYRNIFVYPKPILLRSILFHAPPL